MGKGKRKDRSISRKRDNYRKNSDSSKRSKSRKRSISSKRDRSHRKRSSSLSKKKESYRSSYNHRKSRSPNTSNKRLNTRPRDWRSGSESAEEIISDSKLKNMRSQLNKDVLKFTNECLGLLNDDSNKADNVSIIDANSISLTNDSPKIENSILLSNDIKANQNHQFVRNITPLTAFKSKLFPTSSGKDHKTNPKSEGIQQLILERTNILAQIKSSNSEATTDQNNRLKIIDQEISEWSKNITNNTKNAINSMSELPAFIPDLPVDYLMKRHDYKPNDVALKLMTKMGWKPGKALGKSERDLDEDEDILNLELKYDRSGLRSLSEMGFDSRFQDTLVKHPVSALNEICQKMRWSDPIYKDVKVNPYILQVTVKGKKFVAPTSNPVRKLAKIDVARFALRCMGFDNEGFNANTDFSTFLMTQNAAFSTMSLSHPPPTHSTVIPPNVSNCQPIINNSVKVVTTYPNKNVGIGRLVTSTASKIAQPLQNVLTPSQNNETKNVPLTHHLDHNVPFNQPFHRAPLETITSVPSHPNTNHEINFGPLPNINQIPPPPVGSASIDHSIPMPTPDHPPWNHNNPNFFPPFYYQSQPGEMYNYFPQNFTPSRPPQPHNNFPTSQNYANYNYYQSHDNYAIPFPGMAPPIPPNPMDLHFQNTVNYHVDPNSFNPHHMQMPNNNFSYYNGG